MAKGRNGMIKWVMAGIALVGLLLTVSGLMIKASWRASALSTALSKTLEQNCSEDKRVHPIAEQSEKIILGMGKDIGQIQGDISRMSETQKSIDDKLRDLFILQMSGPGSNPLPP